MAEFIKEMPKVELHAHINAALRNDSIKELGCTLYGESSTEFLKLTQEFLAFESEVDLNKSFEKFKFMHQLTSTREGLKLATLLAIRDFALDNVVYLELRTTPKSNEHMTQLEYMQCVIEAVIEAKILYPQITVKLLPSFDRSRPTKAAEETLRLATELRRTNEDLIVGIDLSGNPYAGEFDSFKPLLSEARQNGFKLALHCAEMNNPEEISKIIAFGMLRCGHGTYLSKAQMEQLYKQNVVVECCLTSNVKCKTVATYEEHHFKHLFFSGAPVVISTDGAGIFDTTLSNELYIATKVFKMSQRDLLKLQMTGVEHCFASEAEKQQVRATIEAFFEVNSLNGALPE